jgi:hypothetical protein
MLLFTLIPARKDGTVQAVLPDGTTYTFEGSPLACDVTDEGHIDTLTRGQFMSQEDFEAETRYQNLAAARAARKAPAVDSARKAPSVDDDEDFVDGGTGQLIEQPTAPTGRVRKAKG